MGFGFLRKLIDGVFLGIMIVSAGGWSVRLVVEGLRGQDWRKGCGMGLVGCGGSLRKWPR